VGPLAFSGQLPDQNGDGRRCALPGSDPPSPPSPPPLPLTLAGVTPAVAGASLLVPELAEDARATGGV